MQNNTSGTAPVDQASRKITIQTPQGDHCIELTKGRLWAGGAIAGLCLTWTITATASFLVSNMSPSSEIADTAMIESAFDQRISRLTASLAESERLRQSATERLDMALGRLVAQQDIIETALGDHADTAAALRVTRDHLAKIVVDRDAAEKRVRELSQAVANLESSGSDADTAEELDIALAAVSDELTAAVRDRDLQKNDMHRMESEISTLELKMQITADRQERLVASLEDAVETSFRPLEAMFEASGLSVDTLVSGVRQNYTGFGGPNGGVPAAITGMADPELNARFSTLMASMERMDMMRIAATKVPYTMPVRVAHRFTSGFGTRRDPKTGGRRAHNGIDLAGPRGTPIVSTADGVVVFAGRQSGFGKMIKIRHAYGFETLYAHLNKIHVKVGDRVARTDHIGDMGTTGRSTGVHLHYEVRLGGNPVNPMTYIRAAKNVF
ncbi:MAG: DUF5930 domain-containing protein [Pseudomonadota bacterium]